MANPGLIVAGAVLTLLAAWLLSWAMHWFQVMLLLIGIATMVAGSGIVGKLDSAEGTDPAAQAKRGSKEGLGGRLRELDGLLEEGTLSPAEHRRKRKQLLDSWGNPPEQR